MDKENKIIRLIKDFYWKFKRNRMTQIDLDKLPNKITRENIKMIDSIPSSFERIKRIPPKGYFNDITCIVSREFLEYDDPKKWIR